MVVIVMNDETIRRAKIFFEQDYRERGRIKWNGFFLSDHTQKINHRKEAQNQKNRWLDKTPVYAMQSTCQRAFTNYQPILYQLDSMTAEQQAPQVIKASITAFDERGFWVKKSYYPFESIHHLEVQDE